MVIDASVAIKWVVPEIGSEAASDLLGRELWAPSLWLAEAANALLKKTRRGEITAQEARVRAQDLADAPIEPIELPILLPSAMRRLRAKPSRMRSHCSSSIEMRCATGAAPL